MYSNKHFKSGTCLQIFKVCVVALFVLGFTYGCQKKKTNKTTHESNKQNTAVLNQNKQKGSQKKNKQAIQSSPEKQKIADNWRAFFSSKTKNKKRLKLLQNGQKFKKSIQNFSNSPMGKSASVTINSIKLNGEKGATVHYTINLNSKPVLKNQTGIAVLVNDTWKVSDTAFCKLLAMSGNVPEACPQMNQSNS